MIEVWIFFAVETWKCDRCVKFNEKINFSYYDYEILFSREMWTIASMMIYVKDARGIEFPRANST